MKNPFLFTSFILTLTIIPHLINGQDCPTDCNTSSNNSFVGINAGQGNSTGASNSYFGYEAGGSNSTGSSNSFFGRSAGAATTSSFNSFFGNTAGRFNTSGSSNSFFGSSAGNSNTIGSDNSFFGRLAGTSTNTGSNNAFFGSSAGRNNQDGGSNAFFGNLAGFEHKSGSFNAFFGRETGRNNQSGSNNAFFGYNAGVNSLGSNNICLGSEAGPEPPDSNSSNRLYIDVETSSEPLIYGEFDNDYIRVNGNFEVTAGLMNPSSREMKTGFNAVDHRNVLERLTKLRIEEWSYKEHSETIHIGPVAEDFHAIFGYGSNAHIFTTDANGIAIAAIKALYEDNLEQQIQIELLRGEIAALKALLTRENATTDSHD